MKTIKFADLKKEYKCETLYYKQVEFDNLRILSVHPEVRHPSNTAIVFVHGGGWTIGCPHMYIQEMHYFAERGAECFSVQYRLNKEKNYILEDCIKDVRSAIRYLKKNADILMISPDKIVVIGDSAGGHLVTSLTTIDPIDDESDDLSISVQPSVIINCNGVVDLTPTFGASARNPKNTHLDDNDEEYIAYIKALSPMYNVKKSDTVILNLQGKQDGCVNYTMTEEYHNKQLQVGNDSTLVLWDDAKHAFILIGYTGTDEQIVRAINTIDDFLTTREYLPNKNVNIII